MDRIRTRFPHRSEIIAVLGVAVFVCHSWSVLGFLNKLSSFILYFTVAEIANIFAFMMAFALLESLALTGLLVLLSIILPSGWLRDGFALKGFTIIVVATVTSILFQKLLGDDYPSTLMLLVSSIVPLLLVAALIALVSARPRLQNVLLNVQDRILVMLFVYVPIGLISLIAVMYRALL